MNRFRLHKILLLLLLLGSTTLFANQVISFFVSKGGVTLHSYYGDGDTLSEKKELESYLNFILQNIETREDDLQILIFPGVAYDYPDGFCVSYDSLKKGDTVFISATSNNKRDTSFNYYYPDETVREIYGNNIPSGLIIRFAFNSFFTKDYPDRILSIVNYAIRNIEKIKAEQKYLHVRRYSIYDTISILTLDTANLNAVKTENYGFVKGKDYSNKTRNLMLKIIAGLGVFSFGYFIIRYRKKAHD